MYVFDNLIRYGDTYVTGINVTFGTNVKTQLSGLLVAMCYDPTHYLISIDGRVHNHHCYCYWCYTHITVTGAIRTLLLLVPYHRIILLLSILFQPFSKWFSFAIIYIASVLKNIMLLLPKSLQLFWNGFL